MVKTYIVYMDECGDDGVKGSSEQFILTAVYMPAEEWQSNFNKIVALRKRLKEKFGFHSTEEMHTKHFLADKNPYRKYSWSNDDKLEIVKAFTLTIAEMQLSIVNVIIDKTKFKDDNYRVLDNAVKYCIQRTDNDSKGDWNYIIITDKGRVSPMRKTARRIRAYNPIHTFPRLKSLMCTLLCLQIQHVLSAHQGF